MLSIKSLLSSSRTTNLKSEILKNLNENQIIFYTVEELVFPENTSMVNILYTRKLWFFCPGGVSAEVEQRSSISARSDLRKYHVKEY